MVKKRTSLDSLSLGSSDDSDEVYYIKQVRHPVKPKTIQQTAYLPAPVHEQIRRLAFEERVKMHDYIMEGLDLVFKKRGLPSIAELKSKK